MNILVSNDDGVLAPGIRILAEVLSSLGNVIVMAPERNRSGASNSLTLSRPLRVRQLDNGYYSVEGTPTDCVHLALTGFLSADIDVVVSGINDGGNLGDDVLYSGTVAAAMEGHNLGLPAIAVSMVGNEIRHYETAATFVKQLVQQVAYFPAKTVLNVNVPDIAWDAVKGFEVTRLGKRHNAETTLKELDPRGRPIYWIGPPGPEADAGPGTDFYAIKQHSISVTPLQLDMTHYRAFDQVSAWMNDLERV